MQSLVLSQIDLIEPSADDERAQWLDARQWAASGAPLYRTAKPATPPKHLVAYFPVVDDGHILLVDHRNAQRWLPSGGHVEPGEDPRHTVVRELHEELGIVIDAQQVPAPLMVSVTTTVGLTSGHTDVSLWYPIRHPRHAPIRFDELEFHGVRWFDFAAAAQLPSDPNLAHFLAKLGAGA
ncbi:NUDIX hydrolase [Aquabacterium sp. OR-4]|uniref:NUDIX hydrolase n=1 Tax=Aquabacterium sp. OR-4 TaxID=2978127 RepID=UPI0028C6A3DB|nr:NUDIX hydrolase [Aquabacterium sp. OR-4]MDT7838518.1 NUDIX hydrolase [Aquabacterium sp. OR-4]